MINLFSIKINSLIALFRFSLLLLIVFFANTLTSEELYKNNHNLNGDDSTFKDFIKWQLNSSNPTRVSIEVSDEFNTSTNLPDKYSVWIGHSSFLINNGDINILVDPIYSKRASPLSFIGPKRLIPPGVDFNKLPSIDIVAVSHSHYDHLDLPTLTRLYKRNNETLFLVPMKVGKLLKSSGITNVVELNWWDTISINKSLITFVPVHHWSSRTPFDKNKTLWGGWWIETNDIKIVHLGDTGYTHDFKLINSELGSPDIAFIPIGAYEPRDIMKDSHLNPSEAIQTAIDLNAGKAIGMHWGTFTLTDEPVKDPPRILNLELQNRGLDNLFIIPKPGEIISLE
tara:strand:- start:597 stop:1619 length:1023 start_codon:yes stop_codon:yes gene_type:complete